MIKKKFRLKKSSEINKIFQKGESVKGSLLICKFIINNLENHRPCFTIAKKIKLKTPQRNRLKRQLIASYKEIIQQIHPKLNYDFVFVLYKMPSEQKSRTEQFKSDYSEILKKLT